MKKEVSILCFRQDLRISDNLALNAAVSSGDVLPIYVFEEGFQSDSSKMGGASKVWLRHSLSKLNESLNGNLNIYHGKVCEVIERLIKTYDVKNIFLNKCYEPWHLDQEKTLSDFCKEAGINYEISNSNYLWDVDEILKDDGSHYKIFTAYKNKAYSVPVRAKADCPKSSVFIKDDTNKITISDLNLIPKINWYKSIEKSWEVGEAAASKKLDFFIQNNLSGYKENRDYPAKDVTSKLSPHLHFGEISPITIWHAINHWGRLSAPHIDVEHFLSELIWREFSCYLLHHFKNLYRDNFNNKFNAFAWEDNPVLLKAWQSGNTGYPIIDAGMRELWQTGYMHNRVRMVVASFLVKNLNIHWHYGCDWFWDCLVDADLANNSASWQWVAGSGVDAAPYFRIFSPITQGEKFDGAGEYTRRFVPELKAIPDKYLFKPWDAPLEVIKRAGVELGKTYPKPIVDFSESRKRALALYKNISLTTGI